MDISNIQGLIAQGKIVHMLDIDPTKSYIQIGVYQPGNRENGSGNANTYAPYVIPLSAFAASSYALIQNNGNPLVQRSTLNFTGSGFTVTDLAGVTTINFTVPPPFNGNTLATCITDIFVTNIHSCSPLHIQPTAVGDVYIVEAGGNVGIGMTTPTARLHIKDGNLVTDQIFRIDTTTVNNQFLVNGLGRVSIGLGATPNGGKLHVSNLGGSVGTGDLDTSPQVFVGRFETSTNNPVLMIRENEYVGIRIGTPERHLDVRGDVQVRRIQDATALLTTVDSYSNYLQGAVWNGTATENRFIRTQLLFSSPTLFRMQYSNQYGQMLMAIENTGNVGIGLITAPTEKLHVGGNALISGLSGTGNRIVTVDATGKLVAGGAAPVTVAASKYSITFTPGLVNVANVITHNLATTDVEVTLWDETNGEIFFGKISNRTATTVSVTFTTNPVGNVRIVVVG